ncbi:DDE-type integrase/transposase/recombinase [Neisseria animalis]|uniref:Transposase n=1 Tax=Neisseria animalis TaxID=492 RepID=A0A5P3MRV8_NEIAN|nr:DDE-type integrase/transposase/recombinase [Neisseria animalis]QEY23531.1 transposase [Neisseria animalis]ROW32131.1 transposase [Neisseria animalis]VEE09154.1 putative phage associated protein [Neisseria animalis]
MNPALNERLTAVATHADTLGRGDKSAYLKQQAAELGMSLATLYRKLEAVAVKPSRKRRSDAGRSELSLDEAKLISSALMEAMRRNGKRLMAVRQAVEMLRANGKIEAARIDEETGEVLPLSESTIIRALREYRLHPDQLLQPDPMNRMKSEHPNHCWQIDPSLCVLYYLPRQGKDTGLRVMKEEEFYKNKPKNVVKIEQDRVWRYTGTDHASGAIVARYYFGGETSANLCDFFIYMMQAKEDIGKDPFRGVPRMVMLDPGSANTSAAFKNLCKSLDVHVQINKPGNPRAKGQVEKGNDIVETAFESGLRFTEVADIDQLNAMAERWMRYYNGTQIHSRHGLTRYQAWNRIKAEQLVLPPPAEYCRELALSAPKEAKVSSDLEIRFGGRYYSVKDIRGVLVGQKLLVAKNPWETDGARVATYDADGNEIWQAVPQIEFDEMGFRADAAVIGAEYKGRIDTVAQQHAKELDKLAMGADTLEEAAAKRKGKAVPFNGEIDPYKHQEDTLAARNTLYLPKQGTQMEYNRMEVAEQVLSKVEMAKLLKPRIEAAGGDWKQAVRMLQTAYPQGIEASRLDEAFDKLMNAGRLKIHRTGSL